MAITIDGKEYDEATLDNNIKNSINQVQNANQNIANLQADLLNQQIIARHHSNFIKENLPSDEVETTTEEVTTETTGPAVESDDDPFPGTPAYDIMQAEKAKAEELAAETAASE